MEFSGVKGDEYNMGGSIFKRIQDEVLTTAKFILGPEVERFEELVCNALGVKHAVGMSSGTDALIGAAKALELRRGMKVIVPAYSFISTASAFASCGLEPLFADIDPVTMNISVKSVHALLERSANVGAIVPVHLFGQPADMPEIVGLARTYNVSVIEDACQSFRADIPFNLGKSKIRWLAAGTVGDVGCFSFYPTKPLGAWGDAGMCVTNDDQIADNLRLFRNHGQATRYVHICAGTNARMDAIQAAVLNAKYPEYDRLLDARRQAAVLYSGLLRDIVKPNRIIVPVTAGKRLSGGFRNHVWAAYVIRCLSGRNELRTYLADREIPTEVYYPTPLHLQPMFSYLGGQPGDCPNAEQASREALALPIHPWIGLEDIYRVGLSIFNFYENN